jgi:hypothetical protein
MTKFRSNAAFGTISPLKNQRNIQKTSAMRNFYIESMPSTIQSINQNENLGCNETQREGIDERFQTITACVGQQALT